MLRRVIVSLALIGAGISTMAESSTAAGAPLGPWIGRLAQPREAPEQPAWEALRPLGHDSYVPLDEVPLPAREAARRGRPAWRSRCTAWLPPSGSG
jgi:hypothetical protein